MASSSFSMEAKLIILASFSSTLFSCESTDDVVDVEYEIPQEEKTHAGSVSLRRQPTKLDACVPHLSV